MYTPSVPWYAYTFVYYFTRHTFAGVYHGLYYSLPSGAVFARVCGALASPHRLTLGWQSVYTRVQCSTAAYSSTVYTAVLLFRLVSSTKFSTG